MADKIVAFYQTKDHAERVRDELYAAGYNANDVRVFNQGASNSGSTGGGTGGGGFWHEIKEAFGFADPEDQHLYQEAARRGAVGVQVDLDDSDDPNGQKALQILQRNNPIDLDTQSSQWRQEGWQGYSAGSETAAATGGTRNMTSSDAGQTSAAASLAGGTQQHAKARATEHVSEGEQVIPVAEEQLRVGKRAVNRGGLRVYSRITEVPVQENVELRQERATIERRPVDRPLTDADQAFNERSVEVTERGEEAVVSKEARVVEEVRVGKEVEAHTETVRDTVRRQEVEVEKLNPDDERGTQFASQFASELATDQRYRGRDWTAIETDARSSFEQRYPGGGWERFRDSIRRGYDKARQGS